MSALARLAVWSAPCGAWLLIAALVVLCGLAYVPRTPVGTHCPTARVQRVSLGEARARCCEAHAEAKSRVPRPGDSAFVQCQCAEKQSAPTRADFAADAGLLLLAIGPNDRRSWWPACLRWPPSSPHPQYVEAVQTVSAAPPVPPPVWGETSHESRSIA